MAAFANTLLVVLLPICLLEVVRRVDHRAGRLGLWLGVLAAVLGTAPWQGLESSELRLLKGLLAAIALCVWVAEWWTGRSRSSSTGNSTEPTRGDAREDRDDRDEVNYRRRETARGAAPWWQLAVVALLIYVNFGSFHGRRDDEPVFRHAHDLVHYVLGARYAPELGHGDLYDALLMAEAQDLEGRLRHAEARDLRSYAQVSSVSLVRERGLAIRGRFSPPRWQQFRDDARRFREDLGDAYARVLLDHGYNATPVFTLLARPLTEWFGGSRQGLTILACLDPLLLLLCLMVVARTSGLRSAAQLALLGLLLLGPGFSWIGGGLLRSAWLVSVLLAICAHTARRDATAGALLAVAGLLRVFPFVLLLPVMAWALVHLLRSQQRRRVRLRRRILRCTVGFLATIALLLGLTLLREGGTGRWRDFSHNLALHQGVISPNTIGLTDVVAWSPSRGEVTQEEFDQLRLRRERRHATQLLLLTAPLLLYLLARAPRHAPLGALALGVPLVFATTTVAAYDVVLVLVLLLVHRRRADVIGLLLALEVGAYVGVWALADDMAPVFDLRSLLLLGILTAILVITRPRRSAADQPRPSASSSSLVSE